MSTADVVTVVVAGVVTAAVTALLLARTRHVPASSRLPATFAVAVGLCALVAVLAVALVPLAGQGDPLGTTGDLVAMAARTLVRPLTIVVVVLAADVGFAAGWLRWRRETKGER